MFLLYMVAFLVKLAERSWNSGIRICIPPMWPGVGIPCLVSYGVEFSVASLFSSPLEHQHFQLALMFG